MIEKTCVSCDGHMCRAMVSTGLVSFKVKIKKIKEARWKIVNNGVSWRHYCPKCAEKETNNSTVTPLRNQRSTTGYWWQND